MSFLSSFANPYTPDANVGNLTKKGGLSDALGQDYRQNETMLQSQQNQRGQEAGTLFPQLQSLATNGGTDAENNALTQSVLTPVRGAFNVARDQGAQHAARNRNSAGYGSFLSGISRQEGQASAQAGLQIAQEKFQRKMAGIQGLAQMYGIDTSFLGDLGKQQLGILGVGNDVESRRRGVLGNIAAGVGIVKGAVDTATSFNNLFK